MWPKCDGICFATNVQVNLIVQFVLTQMHWPLLQSTGFAEFLSETHLEIINCLPLLLSDVDDSHNNYYILDNWEYTLQTLKHINLSRFYVCFSMLFFVSPLNKSPTISWNSIPVISKPDAACPYHPRRHSCMNFKLTKQHANVTYNFSCLFGLHFILNMKQTLNLWWLNTNAFQYISYLSQQTWHSKHIIR